MEILIPESRIESHTTVAAPSHPYEYGAVQVAIPKYAPASSLVADIWTKAQFYAGEVFGLLFVLAMTAYIFAVPASLCRAGQLRMCMNRVIKRGIDILGGLAGLVVFAPVWLIVPILIKLDSRGPVFYSQQRVGVNRRKNGRRYHQRSSVADRRQNERRGEDLMGRPFSVLKFRTMVQDAEKVSGPVWASQDDPRITRIGRLLRKTRMDEVPQFLNILSGEMSLVGPRPERPKFVRELTEKVEGYAHRLQVKPGLTGLAQIENGYDSSLDSVAQKVRWDLHYIHNWTVWSDLKIVARTVVVVFTGKGAC